MAKTAIQDTSAYHALRDHAAAMTPLHMRDLFAEDPARADKFRLSAAGLTLDYSKNRMTAKTMRLLVDLARTAQTDLGRSRLFGGEVVNTTENRAARHTVLRAKKPPAEVAQALERVTSFAEGIRRGVIKGATGESFTDIVSIGIGGSYLGPAMATTALTPKDTKGPWVTFVSNVDGDDLSEALSGLNPETTMFIVQSKSFATEETLANAQSAREWLVTRIGEEALPAHFCAVTSKPELAGDFRIAPGRVFPLWDWVGGRTSLWSACGLPIALGCGPKAFTGLLAGAEAMDRHVESAKLEANMAVILAVLSFWYSAFFDAPAHAVLPYSHRLRLLPAHLQQLCMESLGKSIRLNGQAVGGSTGEVVFGEAGTNGQHSFYQLLHQGTALIPADIILPLAADHDLPGHHDRLLAHGIAQGEALMRGRSVQDTKAEMDAGGIAAATAAELAPHRSFPGNRPSNTLVMDQLSPETLGALVALYEHKVFVQSLLMDINAFDQWGVELGKSLASKIEQEFAAEEVPRGSHDASTTALINMVLKTKS